jgi:hypothetical protein
MRDDPLRLKDAVIRVYAPAVFVQPFSELCQPRIHVNVRFGGRKATVRCDLRGASKKGRNEIVVEGTGTPGHLGASSAGDDKVFLLTTEAIECLALDSGVQLWQIDRPALPKKAVRRLGFSGMYEYQLTVTVYQDGVVLLAQPEPNTHHTYHTMPG